MPDITANDAMKASVVVLVVLVCLSGPALGHGSEDDFEYGGGGRFRGRGLTQEQRVLHHSAKKPDEESIDLEEQPTAVPENPAAVAADQPLGPNPRHEQVSAEMDARLDSSGAYSPQQTQRYHSSSERGGVPELEELDTGGYPVALHHAGIVGFDDSADSGRGRSGGDLPGFYTPRIYPSGQAVGSTNEGQMFSDPGMFGWDLNFRSNEDANGPPQGRPVMKFIHRRYVPGAEPASPRNLWVRHQGDGIEEEPDMYPFVRSPQNIMMHEGSRAYYANGAPGVPFYSENSPWHPQHPANPLNPNQDPRNPLSRFHPDNSLNPFAPKDPYSPYYYRNPGSPYYPYNSQNLWTGPFAGLGPQATPQLMPNAGMRAMMGSYDTRLSAYQQYDMAKQPPAVPMAAAQAGIGAVHTLLTQPKQVRHYAAQSPQGIQGEAFYGPLPSEEANEPMPPGYGLPGNYPFVG